MDDPWLPIENLEPLPDGGWRTRVTFPADSPWFTGHFPGAPVLPGIALVALAAEAIRKRLSLLAREHDVIKLSRVRFKQMVLPDTTLDVIIAPGNDDNCFKFKINSANGTVSIGTAFTGRKTDPNG